MAEISPEDLRDLVSENATLAERLEAREQELDALRGERDRMAGERLEATVLSPGEVAEMVDRLVSDLNSQLSSLAVRDGELELKLAVRKGDEGSGFVIPGADSPAEIRDTLHTLSVRLRPDRD